MMIKTLKCGVAATALVAALASVAGAQETTGAVRGVVTNDAGAPVSGAAVSVTHEPTGTVSNLTTDAAGRFSSRGLRVGGPYTVSVNADAFSPERVEGVYLSLGETTNVVVDLDNTSIEQIVVTAAANAVADVAIGPSATFSLQDIERAPAINRDIRDVIRIDPRIYIDESFVDAVQCAGANPRFNSLTVDGARLNDNFGLNSNGYPTERIPFSFDAVEQIAVELAPFDVQYGNFTACNINAVFKTGGNEFAGGAFYDYTNDSLKADRLEGDEIDNGDFDEKRYGVNVGGPILKDRLFFYAAYEKLEGANLFDRSPAGGTGARQVAGVSQAQLDEISEILSTLYGYDAGGLPSSEANEDEKYLVKLDWNITNNHRANVVYNYNDGLNITASDNRGNAIEFGNHLYERGAELNSYTGNLFSDWTDRLSTELRVSYLELDNRQISQGGTDFGEFQINTVNGAASSTVYAGADDSRHSNKLNYETWGYKAAAYYDLGNHLLSAGYEREDLDVFNLFIQETEGEYRFLPINVFNAADAQAFIAANPGSNLTSFLNTRPAPVQVLSGIEALTLGLPERVIYENAAPSNDPNNGAAEWGYAVDTLYAQDEWADAFNLAGLSLTFGVRYDRYSTEDEPAANANFLARNGFSNTETLDGVDLLMPRFGFDYDYNEEIKFRGGFGLYAGGNPNVWLSNNYSNDGFRLVENTLRNFTSRNNTLYLDGTGNLVGLDDTGAIVPINSLFDRTYVEGEDGQNTPGFGVIDSQFDAIANGVANSGVNALDPSFEIPSEWKASLGFSAFFDLGKLGSDYRLDGDFLYSKSNEAATVVDATLEQVGTAPDGRPIYRQIDRSDADCAIDPASAACAARLFTSDFILTNSDGGEQGVLSFALSKSYDWGFDWTVAYAYTDSTDTNPMTSSVAFSNFANIAVSDPNNPGEATSNYEIPNRFTLKLDYAKAFFGDFESRATVFGQINEGRPYSVVYNGAGALFGDNIDRRHLMYVPLVNDSRVVYAPGFDVQAFNDYLSRMGIDDYRGQIAPRNAFNSGWWTKFDVKFEQEFPGIMKGHKSAGFVVIENVGNLLNDEWGILNEVGFPQTLQIVDVAIDQSTGQYVYSNFRPGFESRQGDASQWEVRLGVRYKF